METNAFAAKRQHVISAHEQIVWEHLVQHQRHTMHTGSSVDPAEMQTNQQSCHGGVRKIVRLLYERQEVGNNRSTVRDEYGLVYNKD